MVSAWYLGPAVHGVTGQRSVEAGLSSGFWELRQVDPASQGPSYRLPSALSWTEKQTFRQGEAFSQGHTAGHSEPEV